MAAPCGEIVTVQLGPFSNCLGAHWWNLQDAEISRQSHKRQQESEICSDVTYRQGVTLRGRQTYTPRLIAVDLKGGLSSLREEGFLYEDRDTTCATPAWTGNLSTHREEPQETSPLQAELRREKGEEPTAGDVLGADGTGPVGGGPVLGAPGKRFLSERSVSVWSDFLQTNLHPKSLCVVSRYSHGGSGTEGLEAYGQGEALLQEAAYGEELEDRLHFFTEECDYLQGFHLVCDLHNGFSGGGAKMAELLHDEYPGRGIFSFGTYPVPPTDRDLHRDMYQLLNCIMGIVHLSNHSSLFCPLTLSSCLGRRPGPPVALPHLLYDAESQYHSSAVLALTLDTLSAPYRTAPSRLPMVQLADALSFSGRKVMMAASSLPFPLGSSSLADAFQPYMGVPPWTCLSGCGGPHRGGESGSFSQSVVLRGASQALQISPLPPGTRPPSVLHTCSSASDTLQCYLQTVAPGAVSLASTLPAPCTLPPTFPQFFSPYVTRSGFTAETPLSEPSGNHSNTLLSSHHSGADRLLTCNPLCPSPPSGGFHSGIGRPTDGAGPGAHAAGPTQGSAGGGCAALAQLPDSGGRRGAIGGDPGGATTPGALLHPRGGQ
uniref:Protein misato homolog 1 n=1 Tax=Xenopus tropicalis TaxID=8364 RepID=A0A803J716_XENTR